MAFDYDKIRAKDEGGGHWATYSDLFMVLSLVFLLLYVVASLRNGTMGIMSHIESQQLAKENSDLKEQLKTYNTLKDNYLKTGASQDEQQMYENLIDKISLLKEEAKEEKNKLEQKALENAQKAEALNQYQQLVRNIVNSNLVAQARLKTRENIIGKQDVEIEEKVEQVQKLEQTVKQKEQAIEEGEAQIAQISSQRDAKVEELEQAFKDQKITKEKMELQVAKLKLESAKKLQSLRSSNSDLSQEVQQMNSQLQQASQELNQAQQTIQSQGQTIASLESQKSQAEQSMLNLQSDFQKEMSQARENFKKQMQQQQLSAQARAQKEAQFRQMAEQKQKELDQKMGQLKQEIQGQQQALAQAEAAKAQAEAAKSQAQAQASNLKAEKNALSKDLAKAQELANAKAKAIARIKSNLQKAGIEAQVDGKTGDVIISFGEEYFETGQAALKDGMKQVLKEFMPLYSKSLLEDPETAKKVSSVEIVGFASPTYKGKFVDPVSLEAKDREAVNYNLDLSYYRARSIFDHIFDTNKMKYKHQRDLLPLVKVTGRSFLANENGRDVANEMSVKEYCSKFNCKKAQRVIIRFDMNN